MSSARSTSAWWPGSTLGIARRASGNRRRRLGCGLGFGQVTVREGWSGEAILCGLGGGHEVAGRLAHRLTRGRHGLAGLVGLAGLGELAGGAADRLARLAERRMSFRRCIARHRGGPLGHGFSRLEVGAERRGEVLGELRAPLDHVGGVALGVAGVGRLALCQVSGRRVHGIRSIGAKVMGGLESGIQAAIGERSNPIAQIAQRTTEGNGLVADRLLWLDVSAEDRLHAFPNVPLAADEVLRGRDVPRVQGQLRIGGRGRVGLGGLWARGRLGRTGGEGIEGLGGPGACVGQPGGRGPSPDGGILVDLGGAFDQLGGMLDSCQSLVLVIQRQAGQLGGDGALADRGLGRVGQGLGLVEGALGAGERSDLHLR